MLLCNAHNPLPPKTTFHPLLPTPLALPLTSFPAVQLKASTLHRGWLVGCLLGWLVGCLVGWLVGCLLACLVGWLVAWLVAWLVGWLLGWSVACLIVWLVGSFVG